MLISMDRLSYFEINAYISSKLRLKHETKVFLILLKLSVFYRKKDLAVECDRPSRYAVKIDF